MRILRKWIARFVILFTGPKWRFSRDKWISRRELICREILDFQETVLLRRCFKTRDLFLGRAERSPDRWDERRTAMQATSTNLSFHPHVSAPRSECPMFLARRRVAKWCWAGHIGIGRNHQST